MSVATERRVNIKDRRIFSDPREFDPVHAVKKARELLEYAQFFNEAFDDKRDIQAAEFLCRKALNKIERGN